MLQDKKYQTQANKITIARIVIYDRDIVLVNYTDNKISSTS
jgi:hypothetical protein